MKPSAAASTPTWCNELSYFDPANHRPKCRAQAHHLVIGDRSLFTSELCEIRWTGVSHGKVWIKSVRHYCCVRKQCMGYLRQAIGSTPNMRLFEAEIHSSLSHPIVDRD